jgi:hypothetical protein
VRMWPARFFPWCPPPALRSAEVWEFLSTLPALGVMAVTYGFLVGTLCQGARESLPCTI